MFELIHKFRCKRQIKIFESDIKTLLLKRQIEEENAIEICTQNDEIRDQNQKHLWNSEIQKKRKKNCYEAKARGKKEKR